MKRPTFFLSSTIYDFADLRSAVKVFLERQGCRVLASEFNDFKKPLDTHSYEACLKTIERADYFVLFVGSRVGGWYDSTARISITQQEYRTAYQLQKAGRLRLISFVRSSVWNFKENAKSLSKHLESITELDAETKKKVTSYPNRFATDADFICGFINEISKNTETSAAVAGKGALPTGNWLHIFQNFSEVLDVIEPLIFNGIDVAEAAERKALHMQLMLLLQASLVKTSQGVFAPRKLVADLTAKLALKGSEAGGQTTVKEKDWSSLMTAGMFASHATARSQVFEGFLGSPLLLEYHPQTATYRTTSSFDVLARLIDEIRRFNAIKVTYNFAKLASYGIRTQGKGTVTLPTADLAQHLSLLLRWAEICGLAKALARALDGHSLVIPPPLAMTPFVDQQEMLVEEQLSMDEVRKFVGS